MGEDSPVIMGDQPGHFLERKETAGHLFGEV